MSLTEATARARAVSAIWYYNAQRRAAGAAALYGLYDNNGAPDRTPVFWQDDSSGYRLASTVQADKVSVPFTYKFFNSLAESTDPALAAQAFRLAIAFTGSPQLVAITDAAGGSGHAIVAYRLTPGRMFVADPNYPGRLRTVRIDEATGAMGPYSSGSSASTIAEKGAVAYTRFAYVPTGASASDAALAAHWDEFEAGTIGNGVFPGYTLYVWRARTMPARRRGPSSPMVRCPRGHHHRRARQALGRRGALDGGLCGNFDHAPRPVGLEAGDHPRPGRQPARLPRLRQEGGRLGVRRLQAPHHRARGRHAEPQPGPTRRRGGDPVITAFTGTHLLRLREGQDLPLQRHHHRRDPALHPQVAGSRAAATRDHQRRRACNGAAHRRPDRLREQRGRLLHQPLRHRAAGRGARWMDTANNRPSSEFIYAIEGLEGMAQQAVLYPPIPYTQAP